MDINYLLLLQTFRQKCGLVVEGIFSTLTDIPFNPATILLVCVLYWCVNKRMGLFILFSQTFGLFVNNVIKLCVCAYRPWIRDSRIQPPPKAQAGATGYSFPRGHTMTAVGIYGTLGYSLIQKNKEEKNHKWLWAIILCALVIVVVAFSRNFLSVHTPQDVLVGLLVGFVVIYLTDLLLKWEQKGEEGNCRDLIIAGVGTLLVIISSIFLLLKAYPMDYNADGSLVVDPEKMKNDYFSAAGSFVAVLWGWVIEKRWIKFETEGSIVMRIIRTVCGVLLVSVFLFGSSYFIKPFMPNLFVYYFVKHFLVYFVVVAGYPAIVGAIQRKKNKKNSAE